MMAMDVKRATFTSVARAVEKRVGSDYTVDHSATLHFINSKGELAAVFTPPFDYNHLHADLLMLIARAN